MSIFHIPAYTDNYLWVLQSCNNISIIDPGEAEPVLEIIKKQDLLVKSYHHCIIPILKNKLLCWVGLLRKILTTVGNLLQLMSQKHLLKKKLLYVYMTPK